MVKWHADEVTEKARKLLDKFAKDHNFIEMFKYKGTSLWYWVEWYLFHGDFYITTLPEVIKKVDNGEKIGKVTRSDIHLIDLYKKFKLYSKRFNQLPEIKNGSILLYSTVDTSYITKKGEIKQGNYFAPIFGDDLPVVQLHNTKNKKNSLYLGQFFNRKLALKAKREFKELKDKCLSRMTSYSGIERYGLVRAIIPVSKLYFNYKGVDLGDYIYNVLYNLLLAVLKETILIFNLTEALFDYVKPRKVITYDSEDYMGFIPLTVAKQRNIPTIGIQPGMIEPTTCQYNHAKFKKDFPLADKYLCYGPYYKKILINHTGYKPHQITIVGHPRMDSYYNLKVSSNELKKKYGIPLDKTIVLGTLDSEEHINEKLIEFYHWIEDNYPDCVIIIRHHPGVPIQIKWDGRYIFPNKEGEGSIFELVKMADIILAYQSTVILEGICLRKKCAIIDFDDEALSGFFGLPHPITIIRKYKDFDPNKIKIPPYKKYNKYIDGKNEWRIQQEILKW